MKAHTGVRGEGGSGSLARGENHQRDWPGARCLYEVQQILGHSNPIVTQRYAHLSSKSLQDAANSASVIIKAASAVPASVVPASEEPASTVPA